MDKNLRWPDFIVGGAPKCGTSSLYFWLSAHPEICGSKLKETFFFEDKVSRFNTQANIIEHELEMYCRYFSHCGNDVKAFEATAHYLYYENARKWLRNLPTTPKIVFILREPSAQMYSHYRMVRYRIKTFNGSFQEYVEADNVRFYVEYAKYLEPWLKEWSSERVKILLFEELMSSKKEVMADLALFLGVGNDFYHTFDFEHRNETVAIKSGFLHKMGLKLQPLISHRVQKLLLPFYLRFNSSGLPGKSGEEKEILRKVKEEFKKDQEILKSLLPDLKIDKWWYQKP